jgi:hypothetical protein
MSRQHMFRFAIPASILTALTGMPACALDQPVDGVSEREQALIRVAHAPVSVYVGMGDSNVVGLGHSACVPGQEQGTCRGFSQQNRSFLATLTPGLQWLEPAAIGATSQQVLDVQIPQMAAFVQNKKDSTGSNVAVLLNVGGSDLLEFMETPELAPCTQDDLASRIQCENTLDAVVSHIGDHIHETIHLIRDHVGVNTQIFLVNQPNVFEAQYCVEPGMEYMAWVSNVALNGGSLTGSWGLNEIIDYYGWSEGVDVIDAVPAYQQAIADWRDRLPGAGLPSPDCLHYNDAVHAEIAHLISHHYD